MTFSLASGSKFQREKMNFILEVNLQNTNYKIINVCGIFCAVQDLSLIEGVKLLIQGQFSDLRSMGIWTTQILFNAVISWPLQDFWLQSLYRGTLDAGHMHFHHMDRLFLFSSCLLPGQNADKRNIAWENSHELVREKHSISKQTWTQRRKTWKFRQYFLSYTISDMYSKYLMKYTLIFPLIVYF